MYVQEKKGLVSILSALIVFAVYAWYMTGMYQEGRFDGPEASSLIGMSFLALIGASIAVNIVVMTVFTIIHSVMTGEHDHLITDERDHLIELKCMRVAFVTFSVFFTASMALLALETLAPHLVFLVIIAAMYLAHVLGDVVRLVLCRRGF